MNNFQLLLAIGLAVASLVSVDCNPLSRDKRAVTPKANAAPTAAKKPEVAVKTPVVAVQNPLAAGKKPVVAAKKPVVAVKKPLAAGTKPVVAVKEPVGAAAGKTAVASAPKPVLSPTNSVNPPLMPAMPVMPVMPAMPAMPVMPVMPMMPHLSSMMNPLATLLPVIVTSVTNYDVKTTDNPKLDNFVNAISRTKAKADSSGGITAAQQGIFVADIVKASGDLTGVPKSVQTQIQAKVTQGLGTTSPSMFHVMTQLSNNGDSFTNKATGATLATAIKPLISKSLYDSLSPMFMIAGINF